MARLSLVFTYLGIFASLSGCQTPAIVEHVSISMTELRTRIVEVIGEPRFITSSGHDLLSSYYDRDGKPVRAEERPSERFFTHVAIVGDRRPYDVQVEVLQEEKNTEGGYDVTGISEERTQVVAKKMKKVLSRSPRGEDFRKNFLSF